MEHDMKIPKVWEGEVFIAMDLDGYSAGRIAPWQHDMGKHSGDYMTLGQATIKVELDQKLDARSVFIDGLTNQKEKVLAEAHIKAEAIQHKIDDLLQIEYTTED